MSDIHKLQKHDIDVNPYIASMAATLKTPESWGAANKSGVALGDLYLISISAKAYQTLIPYKKTRQERGDPNSAGLYEKRLATRPRY